MGVKDIFAGGGKLPDPDGADDGHLKPGAKDPINEIEELTYRGTKLRAFREAAGLNQEGSRQAEPRAAEQFKVDVGAIFTAQTDLVKEALEKLHQARSVGPTSQADPYLQHLENDLTQMRLRLETAPADPLELLAQSSERMKMVAQTLKEHLGIPSGVQVGQGDVGRLIELEQLKQQGQERQHQWQEQMEEQRRQWAREDRRWMEEFKLKRMEFMDDRQARTRAADALEDLAGALVENIDAERSEEEEEGQVSQRVRKPKSFPCEICGERVQVASRDAEDATCSGCGEIYDLVESS